jgi:hypothetical protein
MGRFMGLFRWRPSPLNQPATMDDGPFLLAVALAMPPTTAAYPVGHPHPRRMAMSRTASFRKRSVTGTWCRGATASSSSSGASRPSGGRRCGTVPIIWPPGSLDAWAARFRGGAGHQVAARVVYHRDFDRRVGCREGGFQNGGNWGGRRQRRHLSVLFDGLSVRGRPMEICGGLRGVAGGL